MEKVVKITNDIPKVYERVIMEEYYKLICNIYGYRRKRDVTYTRDCEKWVERDFDNRALALCVDFLSPRDKINFACLYDDELLKAMARFRTINSTHIAEVIFTDYPDFLEKEEYVKYLVDSISNWMDKQEEDVSPLSIEVPKGDDELLNIMYGYGFSECDKNDHLYPTSLLERKKVLTNDGPTRSRKKV